MATRGFPITKSQLLDSVTLLVKNLKRPNKFADGRPGRHWYEGFLHRHPELTQRMAQNLTATRASVTEHSIRSWFREINEHFTNSNTFIDDPKRIFNDDESAFFLSPKGNNVLARKGSKAVYSRVAGDEKECLTVLITGNAAGQLAPPMVMYSYERIPKHIFNKVPSGWGIGKSENGWMTSESFFEFVTNVFYPWLLKENITFPIILYVDGHKSHITLPLSNFCREKNIVLISLLPNSTHLLQPLDVGLFKSLKNSWKKCIHNWRRDNGHKHLTRENFATVLKTAIEEINDIKSIFANAFRVCGLFPLNADNVDYSKVLAKVEDADAENETVINPEVEKHLRFLETHIEKTKLDKFYSARGHNWEGNIEDRSLYVLWLTLFAKAGLTFYNNNLDIAPAPASSSPPPSPVHNVVIEIEDGLVLGDGWINNLVVENEENIIPEKDDQRNTPEKSPDKAKDKRDNRSEINTPEKSPDKVKDKIDNRSEINTPEKSPDTVKDKSDNRSQINTPEKSPDKVKDKIDNRSEINTPEKSPDKIKDKIDNRSEINTPEKSPDKVKDKSDNRSEINTFEKSPVKSPDKVKDITDNRSEINTPDKSPDKVKDKSDNRSQINTPEKSPGKSPDKVKNKSDNRSDINTPEKSPDKVKDKSHNRSEINTQVANANNVPSPFKRSLFWPEEKKSVKKKKKEKIPSVTTSDAWVEYYSKKEREKQKLEAEKEERKRKREENRKLNEQKPKRLRSTSKAKENTDHLINLQDTTTNTATNENILDKSKLVVNDYVIVKYEGEHYPGLIKNIENNRAFITTMQMSGLDKWKWLQEKDEIWYDFEEIVEKIKPPEEVNKRGFFVIQEIKKFQNFTS